ncbi:MAG TPA: hybrid sensor histidine kinase/response regulator [Oligoflexia bacterium]|nr:hybrid sensor histidine kinase/response regulator [Oligoflexia bacterium]HMP49695.1 hybrid sensor histidine kinase/response regulator [Oligoflexia bacterium]
MQDPHFEFYKDNNELDTSSLFFSVLLAHPEGSAFSELISPIKSMTGELSIVSSGGEVIEHLEREYVELVILSSELPDISGRALLNSIFHLRPGLPVLFLCKTNELQQALISLREGAWDFVLLDNTKDIRSALYSSLQRMGERKLDLFKENSLKSERFAYWSAVQKAQDGLAIIGRYGLVSFANPGFISFMRLIGVPADSVNQAINLVTLLQVVDYSLAEQVAGILRSKIRGERAWQTEVHLSSSGLSPLLECEDKYFQLDLSSISLGSVDASYAEENRYVLWVRDITTIKIHEQFQRDMIASTSHDLKGPLGVICCAAEMMMEEKSSLDDSMVNLLELIISSSAKSRAHIEEFLDQRKIESGAIVINPETQALSVLFSELIREYQVAASSRGHAISLDSDVSNILIRVDSVAFFRIIGNLLSNAIKFMSEPGLIRISVVESEEYHKISIHDSGPGIEPKSLPDIFNRFSRARNVSNIKGTGLGLFIVKKLMEAHGGRVEVQSELGSGSVFSLYFPRSGGD